MPSAGRAFGEQLGIAPERCYADYQTLFREEAQRPDGIEVVSVTTPNNTHFAITQAALEAGLTLSAKSPSALPPKRRASWWI
ncbi:Oxidoreductase [Klebsiella pneumoniae]|uniref:Oxidoreductase n=1 Tax=Klebsiella pneumoniae TaxID=573 RepID=A0A377W6X3_KLEPN|nr:Oxidoreductase [Klebsiella pneumoniae]